MTTEPPSPATIGPGRPPAKPRFRVAAAGVLGAAATVIQAFAAPYYFVMGLGWAGLWWALAVGQGVVILIAMIVLLGLRKPLLALPLPILSALIALAFWTIDERLDARVCSPEALAAVRSLRMPPDLTEGLEFEHEIGRGCAVHFNSRLSEAEYVQHYVDEGRRAGWEVVEAVPAKRAVLQNSVWVVTAEVNTFDTGLYILGIQPRRR